MHGLMRGGRGSCSLLYLSLSREMTVCETVSLVLEPMSAQPPVPPDDVAERYCHLIMVESLDFGHVSKTDASRPAAVNTTATGVALTSSEAAPAPLEFTARTWK